MISIIVLNYNNQKYTFDCIQSIMQQTNCSEIEVIVVDNASTIGNPDELKEHFSQIKLIKNTLNRGFAGGCNDGIAHATGEYILLLNNDTVLLNNAIDTVVDFLNTHTDIGIATCRVENSDGTPQHNCQPFPLRWKQWLEMSRLHKLLPQATRAKILWGPYFTYDCIAYPDWVWGTFFMFRRSLLNVFPEKKLTQTFWMYIEDMEWCWIARKAGYEIAFLPDGRILHYGGGANHSAQAKQMIQENLQKFKKMYL